MVELEVVEMEVMTVDEMVVEMVVVDTEVNAKAGMEEHVVVGVRVENRVGGE